MPDAQDVRPEWTQVDPIGHRAAVGMRVAAVPLTLLGIIGGVLSLRLAPEWWMVALALLGCAFVALVGVSLWVNAVAREKATVALRPTGRRVSLPVVLAEDITDEMETFRLHLKLPIEGGPMVQHACSDNRCVEAAHALPGSEVPAMIDEARRIWGVIHGPIDR
ncbi:hypothetical protein LTA6_002748 [Microbacterium sp. LTA6]|uniref:hypothetical protein n=1 Tax=Microbacterium sp. LTA6 TaxID=3129771 RepID=UPI00324A3F16